MEGSRQPALDGKYFDIFRNVARTNRRFDTLIDIQQNICPGVGYNSREDDSHDPFKTKPHKLISAGNALPAHIRPTGE